MARIKDENKRVAILQSSKILFAEKGFYNTSISDIVNETGLPVGSIYTYFKNKEEIVRVIIEEGWNDLHERLEKALSSTTSPKRKIKVLIEQFLSELLKDIDLINILLSEAIDYTRIEEKVEKLSNIILTILKSLSPKKESFHELTKTSMKAGLVVYFLGILNAVKISRSASLGIEVTDIMNFVKQSIENAMGIEL
ncbi:MAG: TetR/AcrR family transcriptional regulator [Spirochaetota bacterium]|nr:MAG: TetR/AcrR family transcriptional regulator [Spirochaetota bacterium]